MHSFTTNRVCGQLGQGGIAVATNRQRPVLVRYGTLCDTDMLAAMHRQLSDRTIRLRYGTPRLRHLSDAALCTEMAQALGYNPAGSEMLLGIVREGDASSTVAAMQLVQVPNEPGIAEIAIVVRDDYQREGLGHMLSAMIAVVALERSVRQLRAHMLAENYPVMRLIHSLGVRYSAATRYGETTVLITLNGMSAPHERHML